jgi:hypothetical protein
MNLREPEPDSGSPASRKSDRPEALMSQPAFAFRNFGIHPDDLPPPPESVRTFISLGRAIGQYVFTALVALVGLGIFAAFLIFAPTWMAVLGCATTLTAFGVLIYFVTRHDSGSIELEGTTLTATHLYTGHAIRRSLSDIECVRTIYLRSHSVHALIAQKLLGRVKGVEIRFRGENTKLRILRSDPAMANAQEMVEAILARMAQIGPLDAEVGDVEGQPLVRSIVWRGERPPSASQSDRKREARIVFVCLMGLAFLFGAIMPFAWLQTKEERDLGSVPPHEISLAELIDKGPGANRHVIVTDYQPGGFAFEAKSNSWTQVWLALFSPRLPRNKIRAVFNSNSIRNEQELRHVASLGRLKGICSSELRTSWGLTLGPEIVKSNQGIPLEAAWDIRELRDVPSESTVFALCAAAVGCLAATLLFAGLALWMR